ncbi:MAG: hypothetical protein ACJ8AH_25365 [Stellaceae bacterium]|jgi:hypothetical protein
MFRKYKEYLLDELLEHPVLRPQTTSEGIEHRCIDLIVEATRGYYRAAEAGLAPPLPD